MERKSICWGSGSGNVVVRKSVVSGNGHIVAKNFDPKELRVGDVGIEARLHVSQLFELNPVQRDNAARCLQVMHADLEEALGIETPSSVFRIGDVVSCGDKHSSELGLVVRELDQGLQVKVYDPDSRKLVAGFRPWTMCFTQVADITGELDFIKYLIEHEGRIALLPRLPDTEVEFLKKVVLSANGINCDSFIVEVIPRIAKILGSDEFTVILLKEAVSRDFRPFIHAALHFLQDEEAIIEFFLSLDRNQGIPTGTKEAIDKLTRPDLIKRFIEERSGGHWSRYRWHLASISNVFGSGFSWKEFEYYFGGIDGRDLDESELTWRIATDPQVPYDPNDGNLREQFFRHFLDERVLELGVDESVAENVRKDALKYLLSRREGEQVLNRLPDGKMKRWFRKYLTTSVG
jgi:hypothetical protein